MPTYASKDRRKCETAGRVGAISWWRKTPSTPINLQVLFKRLPPRLGYAKAVWAIDHRLCRLIWKVLHEGVRYVERGPAVSALTLKRRKQRLVTQLKKLGYRFSYRPSRGINGRVVGSSVFRGCGRGRRVTAAPMPIKSPYHRLLEAALCRLRPGLITLPSTIRSAIRSETNEKMSNA